MIVIPGGADIRDVEQRAHGLVALAEVREPEGGDWHPMLVRSGGVGLSPLGTMPSRTVTVQVMSWTDDNDDVTDWLTPFGSWIRCWHQVKRVGGTIINVPLGYYRVDKLRYNPLDGTIEITAEDAGALVADYALTTLAQGEVTTTQTYLARLTTMLGDALAGVPPWWTTILDPGGADAAAKPLARLQYTGERVTAAADLALRLNRKIITPVDGTAAFRLVVARDASDASDITVRGGELGNLEQLASEINRDGIANTAITLYTREVKAAGARTRIEQRRLVDAYAEPDADTAAGGPFGTVTIEVDSTNVTDDTAAIAAADAVLKGTLTQVRDVALDCSPVYGLECGDIIRVEDAQGIATKGILVGAGMGMTAADSWALTVRTFVPVGKWSGARTTVLTDAYEVRDDADWQDLASKSIDLTGQTIKGWLATGGTRKDGGSKLLFTASGSANARLYSVSAFAVPESRRLRVRFSVRSWTRRRDPAPAPTSTPTPPAPCTGRSSPSPPARPRPSAPSLTSAPGRRSPSASTSTAPPAPRCRPVGRSTSRTSTSRRRSARHDQPAHRRRDPGRRTVPGPLLPRHRHRGQHHHRRMLRRHRRRATADRPHLPRPGRRRRPPGPAHHVPPQRRRARRHRIGETIMPGTPTPNYGWPIPAFTDPPDGPAQIGALGNAIDATVKGLMVPLAWTPTIVGLTLGNGLVVGKAYQVGNLVSLALRIVSAGSAPTTAWLNALTSVNLPRAPQETVCASASWTNGQRLGNAITGPGSTTLYLYAVTTALALSAPGLIWGTAVWPVNTEFWCSAVYTAA